MIDTSDHGDLRLLRTTHGKVNALDLDLLGALSSALSAARESPARGLVVTGNGRVFSAGVDLFRVVDGGEAYLDEFLPALSDLVEQLFAFPKPVVAAVDGHAIAGGCVLACAADVRVAAAGDGRIGLPELRVGVPFPAAALEVVRSCVGDHHLPHLVLGGATFGVDEARELGLVDDIVPADELVDEALRRAGDLAAIGPAFAISKAQLRRQARELISSERRRTDANILELWKSPSTLEAIRAYLDETVRR